MASFQHRWSGKPANLLSAIVVITLCLLLELKPISHLSFVKWCKLHISDADNDALCCIQRKMLGPNIGGRGPDLPEGILWHGLCFHLDTLAMHASFICHKTHVIFQQNLLAVGRDTDGRAYIILCCFIYFLSDVHSVTCVRWT